MSDWASPAHDSVGWGTWAWAPPRNRFNGSIFINIILFNPPSIHDFYLHINSVPVMNNFF